MIRLSFSDGSLSPVTDLSASICRVGDGDGEVVPVYELFAFEIECGHKRSFRVIRQYCLKAYSYQRGVPRFAFP